VDRAEGRNPQLIRLSEDGSVEGAAAERAVTRPAPAEDSVAREA
jgi:hypothetical protein